MSVSKALVGSAWMTPCPAIGLLMVMGHAAVAVGQVIRPPCPPPPPPRMAPPASTPALVHALIEDSQRLSEAVQRELGGSPRTQSLRLKANALVGSAQQLDRVFKTRDVAPQRRRQAVRDVRQAHQQFVEAFGQPGPGPPGTRRISERIGQRIGALEEAVGIARPNPTPIEVRIQRALIREYTSMIGEVDTFMAGLNDKVPEGPQIRAEALALRDAVRQLRRFTVQNAPAREIEQELDAAVAAQRVLATRVERLNRGRAPGPNVLRLRRIGEILARIQAAADAS